MLDVLGALIGGIRSQCTRMLYGVVGVVIPRMGLGLQGERGTSLLL